MPHYEPIQALDDIAPEDLLPKTPKRGRKPPVQKSTDTDKATKPIRILPQISIKKYNPSIDTDRVIDNMLQERVDKG